MRCPRDGNQKMVIVLSFDVLDRGVEGVLTLMTGGLVQYRRVVGW